MKVDSELYVLHDKVLKGKPFDGHGELQIKSWWDSHWLFNVVAKTIELAEGIGKLFKLEYDKNQYKNWWIKSII